ncbi:MAG: hypothetical protein NUV56_01875 [Candidatus Uhrbacteria bacterium]|nr:hypothetical protein [Candidatus Uhrbacteria bacterium]
MALILSGAFYGDQANSQRLYATLLRQDREEIFRIYGDQAPSFAAAIRFAFEPRVVRPLGAEDLLTAEQFIASAASAENPGARCFLDVVMPCGEPYRARLPLVLHRRDFGVVLNRLVVLDHNYRGRVLLMRAFLAIANDFNLMPRSG